MKHAFFAILLLLGNFVGNSAQCFGQEARGLSPSFPASTVLLNAHSIEDVLLNTEALYYIDSNNIFTPNAIRTNLPSFLPAKGKINFGVQPYTFWFAVAVRNTDSLALRRFIVFEDYFLEHADMYIFKGDSLNSPLAAEFRGGVTVPFDRRAIRNRFTVHRITFPPNETLHILIRVQCPLTMSVPIHCWEEDAFVYEDGIHQIPVWLYYGIVLGLFAYNMFICWTLRSFTYFVYLLYLLHLSAFLFWGSNGLGFQFFSLPLEISYRLILYLGIMSMSLVCLLTIAFLDVKRLLPGWNRILRVSASVNGLLAFSSWILPIDLVQNLGNPSSGIIALLCAITAVRALWLRYPPARFFALGWAAFLISTILFVLQDEGLIEWAFVGHYGSQAGSAVEMILFSIALASRMRVVEEERKQAREELLETSQKLVETLQESERMLEKKVEERTQTLQLVNEQLYQQSHEIERTNEQLQAQNERLVQLDIEKNEMLGIVSHDLKNPLGAVRNFGDLIRSGLLDSSQIQEIAGQIVSISNRMLELVKNLLDINHLESGSFQMHLVSLNVEPFLESAIWQYTAHCEAKNLTVHFRNDAQESFVQADESALTQVLDNLLSNAVKYSPNGKKIFVKMKSRKEVVRIEIQDEGPGISAEDMKKIFGKFARLTAQPTGGEHSNGLGLSIVKKMVELMNGNVWCESEFGKGATFIVELRKAE